MTTREDIIESVRDYAHETERVRSKNVVLVYMCVFEPLDQEALASFLFKTLKIVDGVNEGEIIGRPINGTTRFYALIEKQPDIKVKDFTYEGNIPIVLIPNQGDDAHNAMKAWCSPKIKLKEKKKKIKITPEQWEEQIDEVHACETKLEAYKKCGIKMGLKNVKDIWEVKPFAEREKLDPKKVLKYEWCEEVWKFLKTPEWDYRSLHWIVGRTGREFKSKFCQTFISHFNGIYLRNLGGASHVAHAIQCQLDAGCSLDYIFVDFPRAAENHKIWEALEGLMDGEMTTYKYHGTPVSFANTRLVVFSNFNPIKLSEKWEEAQEHKKSIAMRRIYARIDVLRAKKTPLTAKEEAEYATLKTKKRSELKEDEYAHDDYDDYNPDEAAEDHNSTEVISLDRWHIGDIIRIKEASDNLDNGKLKWRVNPFAEGKGETYPEREYTFSLSPLKKAPKKDVVPPKKVPGVTKGAKKLPPTPKSEAEDSE
jgi:hypothetical protein